MFSVEVPADMASPVAFGTKTSQQCSVFAVFTAAQK